VEDLALHPSPEAGKGMPLPPAGGGWEGVEEEEDLALHPSPEAEKGMPLPPAGGGWEGVEEDTALHTSPELVEEVQRAVPLSIPTGGSEHDQYGDKRCALLRSPPAPDEREPS